MAIPSKTKYRFQHITPYQQGGRNNQHYLLAKGNKEVSRDSKYGLQSQQGTEITEQQIEAVRKVISRYVKKFVEGKHKP
jgi:ribosomal protein L16/L10AE